MKKIAYIPLAIGAIFMVSCENADKEFPDFDYQTIYFSDQSPIRTITLGEDGDYVADNSRSFSIKATLGGVKINNTQRWVKFKIDDSLVDGMTFKSNGQPVKAMPSNYYEVSSDEGFIRKGEVFGGFDVQLTDAYFADPASAQVTYVVPVRIIDASDSILSGQVKYGIESPDIRNSADWDIVPQNYTLYAVKYKNEWAGCWLSRGTETVNLNGNVTERKHVNANWESEELHYLTTKSLTESVYSFTKAVTVTNAAGANEEKILACDVILTIDSNGNVTVSSGTAGCTAEGSGKYTYHGALLAWGNKDRDQIELNFSYTIPYTLNEVTGEQGYVKVTNSETLVMRDRENKRESFEYVLN